MLWEGEIVIVSGPPGSGKTTTASRLAASASKGVHLESDVFYRWIASGFSAPPNRRVTSERWRSSARSRWRTTI